MAPPSRSRYGVNNHESLTLSGAELFIKSHLSDFPSLYVEENPDLFIGDTEALRVHRDDPARASPAVLFSCTLICFCVLQPRALGVRSCPLRSHGIIV